MREDYGWYFPDFETHFPKMIGKSVGQGGPAEYQLPVRRRSIELCAKRRTALDIGIVESRFDKTLCSSCCV